LSLFFYKNTNKPYLADGPTSKGALGTAGSTVETRVAVLPFLYHAVTAQRCAASREADGRLGFKHLTRNGVKPDMI